jgi:arsenate reductase (glutaredoxin)
MKATIYHNPRCSKSRETLKILEAAKGVEVEIVEYLKTPPSAEKLGQLYERAGLTPRQGLRSGEEAARKHLGDDGPDLLAAMAKEPILIERPLVETDKGVRLCRPPELVKEIL